MKKKKMKKVDMKFSSVDSLHGVVNIINEAYSAIGDTTKTIKKSAISGVLTGALGAGVGGASSFVLLYGLGTVGLSAVGVTSGLSAAGAIATVIPGVSSMVAGIFVLAIPVAVCAGGGVALANHLRNKQLSQEKERLYKEALVKHDAIINALKEEKNAQKDRVDYLQSINILLQKAISDLEFDLGIV